MEHFDTSHAHHLLIVDVTEDLVSEVEAATLDELVALAGAALRPRARACLRPCLVCAAAENRSADT